VGGGKKDKKSGFPPNPGRPRGGTAKGASWGKIKTGKKRVGGGGGGGGGCGGGGGWGPPPGVGKFSRKF